jgi:hypothetical protein
MTTKLVMTHYFVKRSLVVDVRRVVVDVRRGAWWMSGGVVVDKGA